MDTQINSKNTRVQPIFKWLRANGGDSWPARPIKMADGAAELKRTGSTLGMDLDPEKKVSATPARLCWMLQNADKLVPTDGRRWEELRQRVSDRDRVKKALISLMAGKPVPRELVLEGETHSDCLIECEHAFIWI